VDRLAKRGMDHPTICLLCDQEEETLDHLLIFCVFTREFWFHLLRPFGLESLAPQPELFFFMNWWEQIIGVMVGLPGKGLNSLIAFEPGQFGNFEIDVYSRARLQVWPYLYG
jgi:hypothetical protein